MGRRKILVVVAVVIAALGTGVVALYVKGADNRADQKFAATQVLVAGAEINPGETVAAAKTAGKITTKTVTSGSLVPGAITDAAALPDDQVATTAIAPGEQLLPSKFGAAGTAAGTSALAVPKGMIAISVNLNDTGRVAGFVNPGDHVAIFVQDKAGATRVLLPDVLVVAVGTTTTVPKTTTDPTGTQVVEQLPRTLFTLGLGTADAERVIHASLNGDLTFGLRNQDSVVAAGPGITDADLFAGS
ncbi:MAG: hypothetical protein JWO46_1292 [Nocardioidaceae bacterium]|nr:hypothetical protein [Nocardioidaceae bacterium]